MPLQLYGSIFHIMQTLEGRARSALSTPVTVRVRMLKGDQGSQTPIIQAFLSPAASQSTI